MGALSDEQLTVRVTEEALRSTRVRLGEDLSPALVAALAARTETTDNGHADLVILTAEEVSERGDVLTRDGTAVASPGGFGPNARLVVVMRHTTEAGAHRIVARCSEKPTLSGAAHRIITELSVIDVTSEGLLLRELAPKVSAREVQARTGARLLAGPDLRPIAL